MFVVARDKNMDTIAIDVPYTNLVWTRRWFDFGDFQMQVPMSVYDPDWAFFTSPDSDRIAMVQKLQYSSADGGTMLMSGFFAEKALDRAAFTYDYPWTSAHSYIFNDCAKYINELYTQAATWGYLKIVPGYYRPNSPLLQHNWGGQLGQSMLDGLELGGFSYIIRLTDDGCIWQPLEGKDRSIDQNTYDKIILSSMHGDFSDYSVTIDDSGHKNTAKVRYGEFGEVVVHTNEEQVPVGMESQVHITSSASNDEDATADALVKLNDYRTVFEINADLTDSDMIGKIFDLGDIITIRIDEMGLTANTRLVEVSETYNNSGKSVKVGLGSKRMSNIRRATT